MTNVVDGAIRPIALRVSNAYLVESEDGFVLIDTGFRFDRRRIVRGLCAAGCKPGDLRLIVVTHGDSDHSGNAEYLRSFYGSRIAAHRLEVPAVEQGDMFLARGALPPVKRLLKPLMRLSRLRKADRFSPDLLVEDGDTLVPCGFDARVVHVPGHTVGSIGVLTADGAFFSGDFLENRWRPSIATFVDDRTALRRSYKRVQELTIRIVYPGHGDPFTMDQIA